MDAKDLLVHSPRVISNTTPCMFDIKLLCFGLLIGSSKVLGGQQHGGRGPLGGRVAVERPSASGRSWTACPQAWNFGGASEYG
jgi:hypothetical protein